MAQVALTIDLHGGDRPEHIDRCSDWLRAEGLPATFLVPTAMLQHERFRGALRRLDGWTHEIGTHAHAHSDREKAALQKGAGAELDFLRVSRSVYEDFYGRSPRSFRSPTWCRVGAPALATLCELGYWVDASATPQRPGIFSPYPRENPWLWSPRRPHFIRGALLEVPTSALLFPLASPTFATLRRRGSLAFLGLFLLEARWRPRVVNLMLHVDEFAPEGRGGARPSFRLGDLVPRSPDGIRARLWLRERDPHKLHRVAMALLDRLRPHAFRTLQQIYADYLPLSPGR